ncbi:DUF6268 family outer membrane beta-barrel protein [Plebeiibacterium sediminum]|uniref:DUF6268 family outer membrane beta-barrel protein n=1 Tax=Plebeiibacterium sediminum TaxID=2992112 RepID=A0AAE3M3A6_9BACT|nr:DUF6268 family outer membrane beta-barrel protein [Plebeiobacterium sediminum]MCW3786027.1 DUF6268 family outer membrane beta-barrel protein [Plebeiobacterium sediminum]
MLKYRFSPPILMLISFLLLSIDQYAQQQNDTVSYARLSKFTIASLNKYYYSNSDLKSSYLNSDVKMEALRASIQIALPLKNEGSYFYSGLDYIYINSITNNNIPESYYNNVYKSLTYNLGVITGLKNHWSLLAIVSPAIASDFKEPIGNDDLMLGISAIATKRYNAYFEYGIGFSFNTRFKYEMYLPLLTLQFKKYHHELSALLPLQLSAYYCFKRYKIGFEGRLFENYYNADDKLAANINMDKFGFSKVNFGPRMQVQLFQALYFNMAGGITVFNELTSLNKKGNKEEITATPNKLFFNVGLSLQK